MSQRHEVYEVEELRPFGGWAVPTRVPHLTDATATAAYTDILLPLKVLAASII
jgi:hypothetical protein